MTKAIEVNNVSMAFGNRVVLQDISFSVEKGSIHGFLGPNGAGKTTTMKLISKLLIPDSGEIKVCEKSLSEQDENSYQQIGFLLENSPLYGELSVEEYLLYIARIKRVPRNKLAESLQYCVEALDLQSVRERSIENLSKGFKQRVAIAQAIIHKPDIVILDEPTVGLDPQAVLEIRNLILNLKNEHTVLLSSHLLHEMALVCDEVTIISDGKILDTGTIDSLREKIENSQEIIIELYEPCWEFLNYLQTLKTLGEVSSQEEGGVCLLRMSLLGKREIRHELVEEGVKLGAKIIKIDLKSYSLEDIFMSITGEKND